MSWEKNSTIWQTHTQGHCFPINAEILLSCFDFIAISEENSVLANSGSPIFGCPGGLIDRRERGREEKIVSHRARRERREERTNLQRQKAEMFFSVTPVGSSEAGVSKELCGENLIWDRYDPGPPSARTGGGLREGLPHRGYGGGLLA